MNGIRAGRHKNTVVGDDGGRVKSLDGLVTRVVFTKGCVAQRPGAVMFPKNPLSMTISLPIEAIVYGMSRAQAKGLLKME
jgi:hypothetical protein